MPGEYVSDGKDWRPAQIQTFENGRVNVAVLKDPKTMGREVKVPGQGGRVASFRDSLGEPMSVNVDGKTVLNIGPDPAAAASIRKMTGDDNATVMTITSPPEAKPPQVIVTQGGDSAMAKELAEMRTLVKQQGDMIAALSKKP